MKLLHPSDIVTSLCRAATFYAMASMGGCVWPEAALIATLGAVFNAIDAASINALLAERDRLLLRLEDH